MSGKNEDEFLVLVFLLFLLIVVFLIIFFTILVFFLFDLFALFVMFVVVLITWAWALIWFDMCSSWSDMTLSCSLTRTGGLLFDSLYICIFFYWIFILYFFYIHFTHNLWLISFQVSIMLQTNSSN